MTNAIFIWILNSILVSFLPFHLQTAHYLVHPRDGRVMRKHVYQMLAKVRFHPQLGLVLRLFHVYSTVILIDSLTGRQQ